MEIPAKTAPKLAQNECRHRQPSYAPTILINLNCNECYLLGDSTDVKSEPASPDEDLSRTHFGKQATCIFILMHLHVGRTIDQTFFLSRIFFAVSSNKSPCRCIL